MRDVVRHLGGLDDWFTSENFRRRCLSVGTRGSCCPAGVRWEVSARPQRYFRVPVRSKFTVHFVSSSDRAMVPVIVFPSIFKFT